MQRYFIGFIVVIGLIILLIFLLFSGGGKPKVTNKTLDSYAQSDAQVRLTIDGPINADQNHQQVQISVDQNNATFEHLQGYQGRVVSLQNYANNVNAFANFLFALERAGFTSGNSSSSLSEERGYCPLGDRYIFELKQDNNQLERYWATSCGGTKTYNGNLNLTLALFQAQIPNYDNVAQNISL